MALTPTAGIYYYVYEVEEGPRKWQPLWYFWTIYKLFWANFFPAIVILDYALVLNDVIMEDVNFCHTAQYQIQ